MPRDEDKAKVGERITGVHDPKDPDGLITLEQWRQLHPEKVESPDTEGPPDG